MKRLTDSWTGVVGGFWALFLGAVSVGCTRTSDRSESPNLTIAVIRTNGPEIVEAPGLDSQRYVAPLEDAYRRLDPTQDGWESEAFNDAAGSQLKQLSKLLQHPDSFSEQQLSDLVADNFDAASLSPASLRIVFADETLQVRRGEQASGQAAEPHTGPSGLAAIVKIFAAQFPAGIERIKLKLVTVEPVDKHVFTKVLFQAVGNPASSQNKQETLQINAQWRVGWNAEPDRVPRMLSIEVSDYEEVRYRGERHVMFADCTESVLGREQCYSEQFLQSTDHWRSRLPRDLGLDVVANHGLAIGDVNGDGLDDLYICQQGGLPNHLLIRRSDGTLRDATAESGADWLDYCASALLVDLDNDGDRDLVIAQEWRLLFMSNDGQGRFQLEFGIGAHSQTFSLAAADYDQDGDVDVYACGYNPTTSQLRQGAMGEPMPYHDAKNGGRNMLLSNDGNWLFEDVASKIGLGENNTRFSFAASWEDYDNDGDLDLYVANDYGRNNFYRNDGGRFVDIADKLGIEDMSSGMSVSWADYNRDGAMDLYVSNMFSAAGNRITYQRQFQADTTEAIRAQFQRHARGNSLFQNDGNGGFNDVSEQAQVTMGRWAWGSNFVDLNNDGWEDLVVANGFITTDDTADL